MDTVIRFRVATEEKARFEKASIKMGVSLSVWGRAWLNSGAGVDLNGAAHASPKPNLLPNDPKEVAKIVAPKPSVSRALTSDELQKKRDDFYRANMAKGKK